ncbi:MAG: hypothetical protein WCW87_00390 [Candidatus Paceibacterota bacterium]
MKKIFNEQPKLLLIDLDDTLFDTTGQLDASHKDILSITLFPYSKILLGKITCPKILISRGDPEIQNEKIDVLGIRGYFDQIIICGTDEEKEKIFKEKISEYKIDDALSVWVIGNRIDTEIRFGNLLGCTTIHLKWGKHKDIEPKDKYEISNHTVLLLEEIF